MSIEFVYKLTCHFSLSHTKSVIQNHSMPNGVFKFSVVHLESLCTLIPPLQAANLLIFAFILCKHSYYLNWSKFQKPCEWKWPKYWPKKSQNFWLLKNLVIFLLECEIQWKKIKIFSKTTYLRNGFFNFSKKSHYPNSYYSAGLPK